MVVCLVCGKECSSNAGLGQHISYMHSEKSEEFRKRRSQKLKGRVPYNKGKTKFDDPSCERPKQKGKKFGSALTGSHTEETKKKISNAMKGNQNAQHRGDRQSIYNGLRMDSRWEVGVARYLDRLGIKWKYNAQGYKLSSGSYYYPDFFVYENDRLVKLIEVKGYFREKNKQKFELFLFEYPEITTELWLRDDLRNFGIIDREGYLIE